MIQNDGGEGKFEESTPPMLGIFKTICEGKADATWVFLGWEGLEASRKDIELNTFSLEDYDIPYGYAPCLVTHPDYVAQGSEDKELARKFMRATAQGFEFAAENPDEAAKLLIDTAKSHCNYTFEDEELVYESQKMLSSAYLTRAGKWGVMERDRWSEYVQWLKDNHLLTKYRIAGVTVIVSRQSRTPKAGESVSLDALRGGDAGEELVELDPQSIFTNDLLLA